MKILTTFWQLYAGGHLKDLDAFKACVEQQRRENDAENTQPQRFLNTLDQERPHKGFDAPARLRFPSRLSDDAQLRLHERADWQNCDVRIMQFAAALIEELRKSGSPFYVHSAFRTPGEQLALVEAGRSQTRPPRAAHVQGKAVDIVHGIFHWDLTEQEWAYVGHQGKLVAKRLNLKVTWGGDFKSLWDPAHWELSDWRDKIEYPSISEPIRFTPRGIRKKYPLR